MGSNPIEVICSIFYPLVWVRIGSRKPLEISHIRRFLRINAIGRGRVLRRILCQRRPAFCDAFSIACFWCQSCRSNARRQIEVRIGRSQIMLSCDQWRILQPLGTTWFENDSYEFHLLNASVFGACLARVRVAQAEQLWQNGSWHRRPSCTSKLATPTMILRV